MFSTHSNILRRSYVDLTAEWLAGAGFSIAIGATTFIALLEMVS